MRGDTRYASYIKNDERMENDMHLLSLSGVCIIIENESNVRIQE